MKHTLIFVITLSVISFLLHFGWETSHVGLYGGYDHLTSLPITLWATIGDVLYTLATFGFIALVRWNGDWFSRVSSRDIAVLSLSGVFISLFVEYRALATARWFYLETMPLIPGTVVGASPVLQMAILLPLSFILSDLIVSRIVRIQA